VNLHNTDNVGRDKAGSVGAQVGREKSERDPELTIAEDLDLGRDPYNSTGRHVIMKPKIELED
jgi:hypothetical protein